MTSGKIKNYQTSIELEKIGKDMKDKEIPLYGGYDNNGLPTKQIGKVKVVLSGKILYFKGKINKNDIPNNNPKN